MLSNFPCFCCPLPTFFKKKKSFRNTIRVSILNSLDPDHDQHSVGPDLGPNCLQRFKQQMTKSAPSRESVQAQ